MGIFHDEMLVVNRAPWAVTIRYDGQEKTLPPNYEWMEAEGETVPVQRDHIINMIPRHIWQHALNQNPLMGTQDPDDPHVSGAEYLIGDPARPHKYSCAPLSDAQILAQKNNPSRYDYMTLMEGRLGKRDRVEVMGRKVSRAQVAERSMVGTDRND